MASKQKTTQQQLGMWIPVSILVAGIIVSIVAISRNGRNGYFKLK
jgi:hypothetical protein|uniref:Uncharacterized protein n=1 Tax=Ostreococcus mediterraneus virus 2 TaxID=2726183 RepID=A0A6H1QU35_9PHYC|nr:hypothetical protein orf00234 [Ostreococcus mediterraneus virus 2]